MTDQAIATKDPLKALLSRDDTQKRFTELLGKKAPAFISSILSLINANEALKKVAQERPETVIGAAAIAATLDLPINKNLGRAFIVPYKGVAEFQMGWKGFVELALRSGAYKAINVSDVFADELDFWNPLTGEFSAKPQGEWKERYSGNARPVGYLAFFRLSGGFEKYLYMTMAELRAHGKKYSQSFEHPNGRWKNDEDAMCRKTVIKLLISRFGTLSIDPRMQTAIQSDQAVIDTTGEVLSYHDRPADGEVSSKPKGHDRVINEDEFKLLCARGDRYDVSPGEVKEYILRQYKKEHRKDLTVGEMASVLVWMESGRKEPAS